MLLTHILMRYNFVILVRVNHWMAFMKIDMELKLNDTISECGDHCSSGCATEGVNKCDTACDTGYWFDSTNKVCTAGEYMPTSLTS